MYIFEHRKNLPDAISTLCLGQKEEEYKGAIVKRGSSHVPCSVVKFLVSRSTRQIDVLLVLSGRRELEPN